MARTLRTLIAAPAVVVLMMAGFASPSDARCSIDEAPPRCEVIAERPAGTGAAIVAPNGGTTPGQSAANDPGLGSAGGLGLLPFVLAGLVVASVSAVALVVFARRRRSPALQTATAGLADDDDVGPSAYGLTSMAAGPPPDDSHIPRWRRPSVAAARFETDNSNAVRAATAATIPPARPRLAFADSTDAMAERMLVRYDNVPLLEQPDEAFGRILEELQSGDEVEIIESDSLWAHVRAPTGVTGWTPVMTVTAMTDVIFEDPPAAVAVVEPEPSPPEEEPVPLEALLEAIAAERRASQESVTSQESVNGAHPDSGRETEAAAVGPAPVTDVVEPVKKKKAPATPRRPRATRPQSDSPATRKR
jgi:hypothetical protein